MQYKPYGVEQPPRNYTVYRFNKTCKYCMHTPYKRPLSQWFGNYRIA